MYPYASKMKEKKQTVHELKMRRILAAADGEVKYWRAEIGVVSGYYSEYFIVNKQDFKD